MWGTLFYGSDLTAARFDHTQLQAPAPRCGLDGAGLPDCIFDDGKVCETSFVCPLLGEACEDPAVLGDGGIGVVFDGVDLRGIDFRGAALHNATFRDCLTDETTDFRDAELSGMHFTGTNLVRADLSHAYGVSQVDFSGAILSDGRLGANLSCQPSGTGLCGVTAFPGSDLRGVNLNGANLFGADLRDAKLDFAQLRNSVLAEALMDGATVCGTDFSGSSLSAARLTGWVIYGPDAPGGAEECTSATILDGTTLVDADFSGADLTRADLSRSFLSESVLGAILSNGARGANLSCDRACELAPCELACDLCPHPGLCSVPETSTALRQRDLSHVQLNGIHLTNADLQGSSLDGAALIGANLNFVDLSGASLRGARMGVERDGATAATSLHGAYMVNANLSNADLRGANLSEAHIYGEALIVGTLLNYADLSRALLSAAVFTNANLEEAVFDGAQLSNAVFDGANLTNAKLDGAYLQGADFSTAASVHGLSLANAAVSTNQVSSQCTLVAPGSWTYTEQNGTQHTFVFGETRLVTDGSVICPDSSNGPCATPDSLCPVDMGPNPPVAPCSPSFQYCFENCLEPPILDDTSCFF